MSPGLGAPEPPTSPVSGSRGQCLGPPDPSPQSGGGFFVVSVSSPWARLGAGRDGSDGPKAATRWGRKGNFRLRENRGPGTEGHGGYASLTVRPEAARPSRRRLGHARGGETGPRGAETGPRVAGDAWLAPGERSGSSQRRRRPWSPARGAHSWGGGRRRQESSRPKVAVPQDPRSALTC